MQREKTAAPKARRLPKRMAGASSHRPRHGVRSALLARAGFTAGDGLQLTGQVGHRGSEVARSKSVRQRPPP
jgi:hypothetical protein